MNVHSVSQDLQANHAIGAIDAVGGVNGGAIDCKDFDEALIIANFGTTDGSIVVKLQEDVASGGSYADIASAAFTAVTSANDNASYKARLKLTGSRLRYIRAVSTQTGGTAGIVAVNILLFKSSQGGPQGSLVFDV